MTSDSRSLLTPILAIATLMTGTGCVASWSAIVKYSNVPAAAEDGVLAGVYRAALDGVGDSLILEDSLSAMRESLMMGIEREGQPVEHHNRPVHYPIPGYWEDSLTHEVETAFAHAPLTKAARRDFVAQPLRGSESPIEHGERRREEARVWLSGVGFNGDSTIAVVRRISVNSFSAFDEVLMLARRPGYQWTVFHHVMLGGWIS
jgi:hypothetical protein